MKEETIHGYIESLFNRPISKATIATYVRHLKVFLVWLEDEYNVCYNAHKIKVPKSPKKNPYIYNDDEIKQIFSTIYKSSDWLSVRNCVAVSFMLDSGLRQNEVCLLKRQNVDVSNRIAKVYGKGDKERFVPLGNTTLMFLERYYIMCPFKNENVFVNKEGEPMSRNAVKLFMQKISLQLPFEFSSHKLRHNFATNFLIDQYYKNGSMDIYALMTIMGHGDIETTKRYLHVANQIVYSKSHISHIDSIGIVI